MAHRRIFIDRPAWFVAKKTDQIGLGVLLQDGNSKNLALTDQVAGKVVLVAGDGKSGRFGGHLKGGVGNIPVALTAIRWTDDVKAVGNLVEGFVIHRVLWICLELVPFMRNGVLLSLWPIPSCQAFSNQAPHRRQWKGMDGVDGQLSGLTVWHGVLL